jgi:peroxiredoxin
MKSPAKADTFERFSHFPRISETHADVFFLPLTMRQFVSILCLTLFLGLSLSSLADGDPNTPGHSAHGESFNEGPRQEGKLIPGCGNVSFPVTTTSPEAQTFFNQGIGQLHGFWYFEAERSFRQVLKIDPTCLMAYWGLAMANVENAKRAREFIRQGRTRMGERTTPLPEIEKRWIESLATYYDAIDNKGDDKKASRDLVRAWESIVWDFPADLEAKAFLMWRIWYNDSRKGIPISSQLAVHQIAREVLEKNPAHPLHHYVIHLWDYEKSERALASAAGCGPAAPGIAHMWHMPGHIYDKLKRYTDAVWQQEASQRVDHSHMLETMILPSDIHNYAHNAEWFSRNLAKVGRVAEALDVARNMIAQPRIPYSESVKEKADQKYRKTDALRYGEDRFMEICLRFGLWQEFIDASQTTTLNPWGRKLPGDDGKTPEAPADDPVDQERMDRLTASVALAYTALGDNEAKRWQGILTKRLEALEKERDDEVAKVEKEAVEKIEKESKEKNKDKETKDDGKDKEAVEKAEKELKDKEKEKAAEGARNKFKNRITKIQGWRDEINLWALEPSARPDKETIDKFKAAVEIPGERKCRWFLRQGMGPEALETARKSVEDGRAELQPQILLVAALWTDGKKDEARTEFAKLRSMAWHADKDLEIFQLVAPLLATVEGEWRQEPTKPTDLGSRPPLESFGPKLWTPSKAPGWSFLDIKGQTVSSQAHEGKPYILMFYLGKGCSHCMEQLNAFAPMNEEFTKAGLPLMAVSTDDPTNLAFTQEAANRKETFPFPLYSDEHLNHFKAFRAFDDFENEPIHGTFLIDAQGRIRWQHISYEPFMRPDLLLDEAKRLLSLEVP